MQQIGDQIGHIAFITPMLRDLRYNLRPGSPNRYILVFKEFIFYSGLIIHPIDLFVKPP